ncbi:MAG: N-acetylmuramoyl-L-alanine amidase, partial [Thermoplasmata archaeon]|nr:N-acetylmuramoyl-L-alanine amidase [Thermoplasmata archaeon]
MPSELRDRVRDLLDDDPATRVMSPAGQAGWPQGAPRFANAIPASPPLPAAGHQDVKTVIVHGTEGWPTRNKSSQFVSRYTVRFQGESANGEVHPCAGCQGAPANAQGGCGCKWGIGPMYYISNDGTIARLISSREDEALLTWHAEFMNDRSIGVETGNLFNDVPAPGHGWVRVSQTPAVEDVTGTNLFLFDHHDVPNEVIACWFTTANYAGPAREHVGAGWNLYSDAQYRAWAALGRFLAEQFNVPRNVPLLPWEDPGSAGAADNFRRIVLAEPNYDAIVRDLPAAWNMPAAT